MPFRIHGHPASKSKVYAHKFEFDDVDEMENIAEFVASGSPVLLVNEIDDVRDFGIPPDTVEDVTHDKAVDECLSDDWDAGEEE